MRSWHNGSYHTASPFHPAGIAPQLKTLLHAHAQQAKWRAPAFQGLFAYAYVERPCGVVTVAGALHIAYMVKDSFHGSSVTLVGRSWIKLKHLAKDTLLIAATMCLALSGCGTSPVKNNTSVNDNEPSSFETVQSKGGGSSSSFENADVLEISMAERNDSDEDWIRGFIELENDSKTDISSVQVKIAYKDKDGNVVDESYSASDFGVPAGKSAYLPFDILLSDGQTGDSVESIEAASYEYTTDKFYYSIDLVEKTVESHARNAGDAKAFDRKNVLSFEYEEVGTQSSGEHVIEVEAENNGEEPLIQVEAQIALFDEDGNVLGKGYTGTEELLVPGGKVTMTSLTPVPSGAEVASYGVFSYATKTAEPDGDGFNYYTVYLNTEVANGSMID